MRFIDQVFSREIISRFISTLDDYAIIFFSVFELLKNINHVLMNKYVILIGPE